MSGRIMREDVKRALHGHHTNLRSAVKAFKGIVESDRTRASASSQLEIRQEAWKLKSFRERMDGVMSEIARSYARGERPADFEDKLAQLSLAAYFLEKTDEMLEATLKDRSIAMVALFERAHAAIRNILDADYFSKTDDRIIDDYLDGEIAITACAECAGVKLLALHHAVEDYKMKVALRMEELVNAAA